MPFPPQEAELVDALPQGERWRYEPKWDGFRGVLENDGGLVALWSRNGRPLLRYFPELKAVGDLLPPHSALDGEVVIERAHKLDFEAMQLRLHPAESRIRRLSAEIPARFIAFDVLLWDGVPLHRLPFGDRRAALEALANPFADAPAGSFAISPSTNDVALARRWLDRLEAIGLDGVVAKRSDLAYAPGSREAVLKVKKHKTADCVIVGYRGAGKKVSTLLLGLYREEGGVLDFVGHTSGISAKLQTELAALLPDLIDRDTAVWGQAMDGGRMPRGQSRWSERKREGVEQDWVPLRPVLVCEVRYDKMEESRFRHGTGFLRFRPDKDASKCTWAQVRMIPRADDPTIAALLDV